METKIVKLAKILVALIYLTMFGVFGALQLWSWGTNSSLSVGEVLYWLLLVGWIFVIWEFAWESLVSLSFAFIFFVTAALLAIVGLRGIAETVMRISFIGWMVGIGQALVEYVRIQASGNR